MKTLGPILILLFGWFPAFLGIVDLISWFFIGHGITVTWDTDHMLLGFMWCMTFGLASAVAVDCM